MFYRKYIFGLISHRDKSPQSNSFQLVSKNFKVAIFEIIFGLHRTNELRTIQLNELIQYQNIDFILYFKREQLAVLFAHLNRQDGWNLDKRNPQFYLSL